MKTNRLFTGLALTAMIVLTIIGLYAAESFPITHRRAGYFLIKTNSTDYPKTGTLGYLYVKGKDRAVGTCKVIETYGKEYLCIVESIDPRYLRSHIHRASFNKKETAPPKPAVTAEKKIIKLDTRSLQFNPLPGNIGYYLSAKPISIRYVEPQNLSGIKKILYKIETVTRHTCRADLLDFQQISQWKLNEQIDFANKEYIYLGTVGGNLSMIFEENGILKHIGISPTTLNKFRNLIYFYIVLRKGIKTK